MSLRYATCRRLQSSVSAGITSSQLLSLPTATDAYFTPSGVRTRSALVTRGVAIRRGPLQKAIKPPDSFRIMVPHGRNIVRLCGVECIINLTVVPWYIRCAYSCTASVLLVYPRRFPSPSCFLACYRLGGQLIGGVNVVVSVVRRMNKVTLRRTRLVLGWLTVRISVCNQPTTSTQSCIPPPESLNRVST